MNTKSAVNFPGQSARCAVALLLLVPLWVASGAPAAETPTDEPWLRPCQGPTRTDVDATTLDGKVLCGYQGWFNTPGDGTGFGFTHWGQGLERTNGGRFTVDMWPDVSEYAPEDLREVPGLTMPDGSPARLYSAFRKGPVLLHCCWMRQYGIDGVFLSRFIGEAASPWRSRHVNHFVTYEGLPSDWYLKLTGAATRMIRGETPMSKTIPEELPFSKE